MGLDDGRSPTVRLLPPTNTKWDGASLDLIDMAIGEDGVF